jgi:putative protease
MVGERVGTVTRAGKRSFTLDPAPDVTLHNGDGLCFFDGAGNLRGTVVTAVRGREDGAHGQEIAVRDMQGIRKGLAIHRNHDHDSLRQIEKSRAERKIAVRLALRETETGFALTAEDEDGNTATSTLDQEKVRAEKPERALANVERQLHKTGGTAFVCSGIEVDWQETYYLPLSALNALRRETLERLSAARARNLPKVARTIAPNDAPYPERTLTYRGNVLNHSAETFYRRHGVTHIEPAAESGLDLRGRQVMRTRHCLKHQIGRCPHRDGAAAPSEPLTLVDEKRRRFALRFDCAACEMAIVYEA